MKIGELAKATGLSTKTIRFYESEGLIPNPPRTGSGYRAYDEPDVARVGFIRKAKRLGLTLDDIKGILQLHDRSEPTCVHVRSLLDEKLVQIEAVIQDLLVFKEELKTLQNQATTLTDCRPMGGDIRSIIENSSVKVAPSSLGWTDSAAVPQP